jgi:uncharacterized protein with HEPN domain
MQRERLLKYLLDIEQIIGEIEHISERYEGGYNEFRKDWVAIRAIERQLQIIGEAVNELMKLNPAVPITSARNIVDLRNLIVHAYDSVDHAMLWGIIRKDIPVLKLEIERLRE